MHVYSEQNFTSNINLLYHIIVYVVYPYNIQSILQINHLNYEVDVTLKELRQKRGYTYEDELTCSKECLENYEEKVQKIFLFLESLLFITKISRFLID